MAALETLTWGDDAVTSKGVSERPFQVVRDGDVIPGILWTRDVFDGRLPLVLMGHGGQSEKRNSAGLAMARRARAFDMRIVATPSRSAG